MKKETQIVLWHDWTHSLKANWESEKSEKLCGCGSGKKYSECCGSGM